mgnify:CR=1 FL=1
MRVEIVQWTNIGEDAAPWARVFVSDFEGVILVRTSRRTGERAITAVVVDGKDAPHVVRELPMGRIEFLLRQLPDLPHEAEVVNTRGNRTSTVVCRDPLAEAILDTWNLTPQDADEVYATSDETREPLKRPTGQEPDEFYRRVAEAYTEVIRQTRAVAPVLAEEADVPVRTVHGWIRESRRRGFLPPGKRGRA